MFDQYNLDDLVSFRNFLSDYVNYNPNLPVEDIMGDLEDTIQRKEQQNKTFWTMFEDEQYELEFDGD
jgi:hypothetical protein